MTKKEYFHSTDAHHAKNVGEDSISDPVQSVLELAKNGYDADATEVTVSLIGHSSDELIENQKNGDVPNLSSIPKKIQDDHDDEFYLLDKIIIEDDGIGMSDDQIEKNYFRLGTSNKIDNTTSRKYGRIVTGSKGMGHFAAQSLGNVCKITSNPEFEDSNKTISFTQDWDKFNDGDDFDKIPASANIETRMSNVNSGFKIEISKLKNPLWTGKQILKLKQALSLLRIPKELDNSKEKINFQLYLDYPGEEKKTTTIDNSPLDNALFKAKSVLLEKGTLVRTTIFKRKFDNFGNLVWIQEAVKEDKLVDYTLECGKLTFEIYHFGQL